jgi:molybdopterin molybdotransferase
MPISITEALDHIYTQTPVVDDEWIPIEEAVGRVIAEDLVARYDLPRFDNSAMDGYAVKCSDAGGCVPCTESIFAGDLSDSRLEKGSVMKIMTGAPIPKGCDAIVPVEEIQVDSDKIILPASIKKDAFIRRAGEDIKSGDVFLEKGEKVTAYTIAMLASQGMSHIRVKRKIRVAVFGTGDELRPHFEHIEPHQLYNSNTPMFLSRAKELGCETQYIRSSKDTMSALQEAIRQALHADIIITSGGISMGDRDFTKDAFGASGMKLFFEGVDIKPGKPTAFGKIGNTVIINLPGNPLASMVNYEIFVRAAIRKMSGLKAFYHHTIKTTLKSELRLKKGKYTVKLGQFDGQAFDPIALQMPGMVSPLQAADGMIITLPDVEILNPGDEVRMIPIWCELGSEKKEEIFTS